MKKRRNWSAALHLSQYHLSLNFIHIPITTHPLWKKWYDKKKNTTVGTWYSHYFFLYLHFWKNMDQWRICPFLFLGSVRINLQPIVFSLQASCLFPSIFINHIILLPFNSPRLIFPYTPPPNYLPHTVPSLNLTPSP